MARTMSVHDDKTGITAAMVVDDDGDPPRCVEIRFTADDGRSVTANDLRLLAFFGLKLPTAEPAPARPQVSEAARNAIVSKPPPASRPAKKKPPSKRPYFTGRKPDDETLLKLWLDNGRVARGVAEAVGCGDSTAHSWIAAARGRGVNFPEKQS